MPNDILRNKVALITGSSRGIGKAIAFSLAEQGASIVLTARDSKILMNVAQEINNRGGTAVFLPADLQEENSIHHLVSQSIDRFGKIDILVNNAGLGIFSDVISMKTDDFDSMWSINMRAVFLLTKTVLAGMIAQQNGDIINIVSLAGKNAIPGGSGYVATKWALLGFSKSIMLEVRKHNVRVVSICPGSVNTEFSDHSTDGDQIIQPQDVAESVLLALTAPRRTNISEIDIRPAIPPKK